MARAFSSRSALPSVVLMTSGSSSAWPIFLRGFRLPKGFWKTICTSWRRRFFVPASAVAASTPPRCRWPEVGVSIIVICRASVLLPQPDSPTTASVLPACSWKDTPSSARATALGFMKPCDTL